MTAERKRLGERGEDAAVAYLERSGLTIVERNWRCPSGEIDIVALDEETLVLCEVKTRRTAAKGTPEDAVTPAKQRRYAKLAAAYVQRCGCRACRGALRRRDVARGCRGPGAAAALPRGIRPGVDRWRSALCGQQPSLGVEALAVDVEVDVGAGLPTFAIVGLPDLAVQEARERVRSALRASGFDLPNARIVVNLAPGPLRKHGTGFDLPHRGRSAHGDQAASACHRGRVHDSRRVVARRSVRSVHGMLAHALAARAQHRPLLGPADAVPSLSLQDLDYRPHQASRAAAGRCARDGRCTLEAGGASNGRLRLLGGGRPRAREARVAHRGSRRSQRADDRPAGFGQDDARQAPADDPAAARKCGAPGDGARPLRRRTRRCGSARRRQAVSRATPLGLDRGACRRRLAAASGRGLLAHNGVLFLDEMPEFGPAALQALRQPLEDGHITLVRAEGRLLFPARFALVGAANPCPCGFLRRPPKALLMPSGSCGTLSGPDRRAAHGPRRSGDRRGTASTPGVLLGTASRESSDVLRSQVLRGARTRKRSRYRTNGDPCGGGAAAGMRDDGTCATLSRGVGADTASFGAGRHPAAPGRSYHAQT